jgi:hypothetical protein
MQCGLPDQGGTWNVSSWSTDDYRTFCGHIQSSLASGSNNPGAAGGTDAQYIEHDGIYI